MEAPFTIDVAGRMWLELKVIFDRLSTDPSIRAVVLTGAGPRAFSAGLDVRAAGQAGLLGQTTTQDGARTATTLRRKLIDFQECISSVERCEKRTSSLPPCLHLDLHSNSI